MESPASGSNTVIVGDPNPDYVRFNESSRKRRDADRFTFNRLIQQPHIALIASKLWQQNSTVLSLSAAQDDQFSRLKELPSFQSIVLSLADADARLVRTEKKTRFPRKQRSGVSSERVKLGDSQLTLKQILRELLSKPEYRDATPSTLIPHLFSYLRDEGCSPKLFAAQQKPRSGGLSYEYHKIIEGNSITVRRKLTMGSLQNLLCQLRGRRSR